jgi:DNA-binding NtrC family response regulator
MDGFELIRRIRQDPAVKDVVIIATSASVYEEDHRKSADAGSNAFLPKPVESGRLFEILQQFLNIEWLYEPLKSLPKNNGHTRQPEFVLPSAEHLQILCDFADTGDIEGIRDCLKELAASDETLLPFAYRLQELAKNFKLNEISRLLEEYMNYEAG